MGRNPHYWRSGQPYLDGVEFRYITNDNTRILSLQSGQVDVAESIPFSQVDALNKGNTRVEVAPLASIDAIWLNNTHKPFDDKLVRQALNYATDKEAINRVVYFGHAEVATASSRSSSTATKAVKNYPFDMDKAKALLAKSSAPKGFDVTILIPSEDQTKAQMMAVVKQLLEQARRQRDRSRAWRRTPLFTKYMNGDYEASDPLPAITADVLVPDELALAWLDPKGVQKGFWSFYKSQKALGSSRSRRTRRRTRRSASRSSGRSSSSRSTTPRGCRCSSCRHAPGSARRCRTSTRWRAAGGTSGRSGRAELAGWCVRRGGRVTGLSAASGAARPDRPALRHARRVPADPPGAGRPGARSRWARTRRPRPCSACGTSSGSTALSPSSSGRSSPACRAATSARRSTSSSRCATSSARASGRASSC